MHVKEYRASSWKRSEPRSTKPKPKIGPVGSGSKGTAGFLAWILSLWAALKAWVLPEAKVIPNAPGKFSVLAWRMSRYDFVIRETDAGIFEAESEALGIRAYGPTEALARASALQEAHEKHGPPIEVLALRQCAAPTPSEMKLKDKPTEVEFIIADIASKYKGRKGVYYTMATPEGAVGRLTRAMRRAALSRVRRYFRREERADIRAIREARRKDRAA